MSDPFDLPAYLRRVGFSGAVRPDLPTLRALQAAQVRALAFEGLDPFLGRPVALDIESLQAKIVGGRRGGYCFELNGLFQAALTAIGFAVTPLAARVRWMSPPDEPLGARTHMLLKVETSEGAQLVDVGFGACMLDAPLAWTLDQEQTTALGVYRLRADGPRLGLETRRDDGWRALYVFDEQPQLPSDYEMANYATATSDRAPFIHVLIVERLGEDRRWKLINRRFVVETRDGVVERERPVESAEEMASLLDEVFGLTPPVDAESLFARTRPD